MIWTTNPPIQNIAKDLDGADPLRTLEKGDREPWKTERVGFEPTEGFPSNDFESFAFDHSATSPSSPHRGSSPRAYVTLRID